MKLHLDLSRAAIAAILLWFGLFSPYALAQRKFDSDDVAQRSEQRIRELEDRVRHLEAMVQTLVEAQGSSSPSFSRSTSFSTAATFSGEDHARVMPGNLNLAAEQFAEKLDSATSAPKGVTDSIAVTASLKRCPDTNRSSSANCEALVVGGSGAASDPAPAVEARAMPQELLPNLGKIGGAVSFRVGANSGPFSLNTGSFFGGAIELPLALAPGGRLNYEISLGLAQANRNLAVTSNVAQISNLAVLAALNPNNGLANIQQALSGTGDAPFPVTNNANWKAQVLQLVPFALKYNCTLLDRYRLRPYALLGLGTYVSISHQAAGSGLRSDSSLGQSTLQTLTSLLGASPFGGSLIGGQIGPASQLNARNLPAGQGGLDLGLHYGTGLEYRLTGGLSFALDARFNKVPDGLSYHTETATWGLHF
jgi:hypothetical protein